MLLTSAQVRQLGHRPAVGAPPPTASASPPAEPPLVLPGEAEPVAAEGAPEPLPADSPPSERAVYGRLAAAAASVFAAAAGGTSPDERELVEALRASLAALRGGEELLAETVRQHHKVGRSWPQRAANTAVLALRIGLELDYEERPCLALGLCALMHDLGMTRVPPEVLASRRLTPVQLEALRQHPVESQRLIAGFGPSFAWVGRIAVQVHERQDGSGYPLGLRGTQIHEMARIVGLADTYEAMAHPRADRQARVTYHALKEIIDRRTTLFEPRLIKALIHIVSIFPLGSLVKLNSGDVGRVIATSRSHPTRPTLEVLLDSRGRRLEVPRRLNLEDEPMLYIVDPAIEEGVLEEGEEQRAR